MSELVHIGIILSILAVVAFVTYGLLQRVPADKDVSQMGWASTAKRKILLEERIEKQRRMTEIVHLPGDKDGGTPAPEARVAVRPLPKPVTRVRSTGYWIEKAGQIVPTPKALAIEQWALSW